MYLDLSGLSIWRFEDPTMGPRRFPLLNDYKSGKVELETGIFSVNVETNEVFLTTPTGRKEIGTALIYVVG